MAHDTVWQIPCPLRKPGFALPGQLGGEEPRQSPGLHSLEVRWGSPHRALLGPPVPTGGRGGTAPLELRTLFQPHPDRSALRP